MCCRTSSVLREFCFVWSTCYNWGRKVLLCIHSNWQLVWLLALSKQALYDRLACSVGFAGNIEDMTCTFTQLPDTVSKIKMPLANPTSKLLEFLGINPNLYEVSKETIPYDPSSCDCCFRLYFARGPGISLPIQMDLIYDKNATNNN